MIAEVFEDICGNDQEIFDMEKNFEVLPDEIKNANKSSQNRFKDIMRYIHDNVR